MISLQVGHLGLEWLTGLSLQQGNSMPISCRSRGVIDSPQRDESFRWDTHSFWQHCSVQFLSSWYRHRHLFWPTRRSFDCTRSNNHSRRNRQDMLHLYSTSLTLGWSWWYWRNRWGKSLQLPTRSDILGVFWLWCQLKLLFHNTIELQGQKWWSCLN